MQTDLAQAFLSLRFEPHRWKFVDFRIDIPPASFGSDSINPHTQYSNPLAILDCGDYEAVGASFTLGEGNQMVCEAADFIVGQLAGVSVAELIASEKGFYESLTNPLQIRWLSPNAGIPLMAAGLVVNTLLDAASKSCALPAWEYLARLPSAFLLDLLQLRHLPQQFQRESFLRLLDEGLENIDARCKALYEFGLPVYYTTWIGHDAKSIAEQIRQQYDQRGIKRFKLKIGSNIQRDVKKIQAIKALVSEDTLLYVDANQTLSFDEATEWMKLLSERGILWLEEPFAPDNVRLFGDLVRAKIMNGWSCQIVTGENCPNHYTGATLMEMGIDRFQTDPCRMLGLLDTILTSCVAKLSGCTVTPHAGGSSLDEQSLHIQLFNLARVRTDINPLDTLTENVGFCSRYFAAPTIVRNGIAETPLTPGLLVGLRADVASKLISYKDGVTWLEL